MKMGPLRLLFASAVGILVLSSGPSLRAQGPGQAPAPRFVRGRYIVVFHDAVANPGLATVDLARQHGLAVGHVYSTALKGFSAAIPDGRLNALMNDPRVRYVEQDQEVEIL